MVTDLEQPFIPARKPKRPRLTIAKILEHIEATGETIILGDAANPIAAVVPYADLQALYDELRCLRTLYDQAQTARYAALRAAA